MAVKKNSHDKDEYKLTEDEYDTKIGPGNFGIDEEPLETGRRLPRFHIPFSLNKKLIFFIVMIVVAFVLFQFLAPFKKQVVKTEQPTVQPQLSPAVVSQPTVQQSQLDSLTQQINANNSQINSLKDQLLATEDFLSKMGNGIADLEARIQLLTNEIAQLKKSKSAAVERHVVKTGVAYHIRAIVPGRAWLVSSTGRTLSVRLGSELGNYGSVTAINWEQGSVVTSSGIEIHYGVNDI